MVTLSGLVTVMDRRAGKERENGGNWPDTLKVVDDGTGRVHWFELAQHVNGDAPEKGSKVRLRIALSRRKFDAAKKDGRGTYEKHVDAAMVVGFEWPAPAAAAVY